MVHMFSGSRQLDMPSIRFVLTMPRQIFAVTPSFSYAGGTARTRCSSSTALAGRREASNRGMLRRDRGVTGTAGDPGWPAAASYTLAPAPEPPHA